MPPPAPAQSTKILSNGNYYIQSVGRGTACNSYLSAAVACGTTANANGVTVTAGNSGTGLQIWTLAYLSTAPQANTYDLTVGARSTCNPYLSADDCSRNLVDMYYTVNSFPLTAVMIVTYSHSQQSTSSRSLYTSIV